MFYESALEKDIYELLCDTDIFKFGYVRDSRAIGEEIVPRIQKLPSFMYVSEKDIKHSLHQVLQTRNNCVRNTNYADYESSMLRDISTVKKDFQGMYGHNIYLFGALLPRASND